MSDLTPISPESAMTEKSVLVFQEKFWSLTGNSGKVYDGEGNVVYTIQGKISITGHRIITDADGNEVAQMNKKFLDLVRRTCYLGDMKDGKKISIKATDLRNITTKNASFYRGDEKLGRVEGGFLAKDMKVTIGDRVVAEADRKWLKPAAFANCDTYPISIEPGVDRLFIAMLIMAYDEMYADNNN
eukprot:CAMPEP_0181127312 /NCGR_PEP_ID=MMETSP1071-20121207/28127_1 /TAXON_ID=35127 /ORGANISM="Thalassiosira sp., Strain NH16" /LENGTH=185 /DNA_ID=CAMNT_0023213035 /DNA_START=26 /DNA_END=583 /DNA_ORIENTATION=+